MATHTYVVLACDGCGVEHDQAGDDGTHAVVEQHQLAVDRRKARLVDACTSCWSAVEQLAAAGRRVPPS